MSRRNSGLLISQLLECLGAPLTEEQVWGLCYEICKSLVDTSNKETIADEHGSLSYTRVVFQLDTVYLRKEGSVAFVLDENPREAEEETEDSSSKEMSSFCKLLMACLENGVSEFGKRQIGDDLETLMRHMTQGNLKDTHGHWVHLVSDYCVHHATPRNVPALEYYRQLCKILVNEALEMSNFLEVLKNEFVLLRPHDALCALQLFQTRPTVRRWLQVMSELREDFSRAHIVPVRSPKSPLCFVTVKDICSQPGPPEIQSPPRSKSTRPSLIPSAESLQLSKNLGKPAYFSTPVASCKPARKVLRPPQRLVDQVTSWMLDAEDWEADNTSGFRTPTSVNKSGHWSELDSQGFDHDFSWSSGQQPSRLTSALGWYRETKRIRGVLTELQLDTVMEDESLFDALQTGKICFCCRHTKFSLFTRWGVVCNICERKMCGTCVVHVTPRDLGITSRDQVDAHHGEGVLKQIRRAFKSKPTDNEKYINICKDCRDFVQRFY